MKFRARLNLNLQWKFVLGTLLSLVVFAAILFSLTSSFSRVRTELVEIVEQQIQQSVANPELADEQEQLHAVETARKHIDQAISTSKRITWGALILFAGVISLIFFTLHRRYVRMPMEKLRSRFLSLHEGDYSTPITLDREDEWKEIETVFNDMLSDMQESWATVQESERRYRSIFNSISVGIFQSSLDGELLNINPAMAEILGIRLSDISGARKLAEFCYADKKDRQQLLERLHKEEIVNHFEVQLKRFNGELFWGSISCHFVRDSEENVLFIEGTVDDISRRHKAAEELHELKEYLHGVVDAMPSILLSVKRDLTVSLWNSRIAEVSGVAESDAHGKPLADIFTLIEPRDYLSAVEETLAHGNIARLQRLKGCASQQGKIFDLVVYPLGVQAEEAVLHVDDVTEKAKLEEVMIQSEKMLSVGNLAAGMAHEINNPLASVLQNVQVMEQRLSPALKKNQQVAEQLGMSIEQVADYARLRGFDQMITSIAESGQRAARIIENMLNFSRKSASDFVPHALAELVDKTIELAGSDYDMKHSFDFRQIRLTRDYQNLPLVPCEASQIQQVVLSLLKNAAQAISKNVAEPEIVVRIFQQGDAACLQVEDNGDGMNEETCRRIFEPFFTTKEVGVGTGLGLSVAYFLITENHNGHLSVTSDVGKGTCFTVTLPLVSGESNAEN
ncbi:PAS domain S-box-containing protein [Malonomonas rubra DSM 5091]|uniref:histidine kinase n=1 Tax=Malonomonas rubra DSM 5091 TaxID=1122189 RepID=A0A1M6F5I7_MALRU|nr:ATP-binding protein [Malonomonas rubra]SHI92941.1 PAS domain S-box-containing protein [Malonomonas rubra DSM 5091]